MSKIAIEALRVLLTETVDYAGLFPPSGLSMANAVQNYADYLDSEHAWILGRFIVPAARLAEFVENAEKFWQKNNQKIWRVSVLANDDLPAAIGRVREFNRNYAGKAAIDCLETRGDDAEQIRGARRILTGDLTVYFELAPTPALPEQISVLATGKSRAKIRTGGVAPEAFPPIDELIKFARVCLAANVPFKATAGLHHPLRTVKPLTYEQNAPTGTMHGFLNLFLATALMRQNLNNGAIYKLMADGDANNFRFDDDAAEWNGNRIDLQQLKLTRTRNIVSFGSCSFTEPVEDLQQLGFL